MIAAHGTFIGSIRLESKKPQQVPLDSQIHFGASTRTYVIRERPQNKQHITGAVNVTTGGSTDDVEGGLLGLPELESELDVSVRKCCKLYDARGRCCKLWYMIMLAESDRI